LEIVSNRQITPNYRGYLHFQLIICPAHNHVFATNWHNPAISKCTQQNI